MSDALRHNAARDGTEAGVVRTLERMGCSVDRLPGGGGRPDLLVGFRGRNHLVEVKTATGDLRQAQIDWAAAWRGGQVTVLRNEDDAASFVAALASRS